MLASTFLFLFPIMLSGCGGDPSGPDEVVDIELDGHYEGHWVLFVTDTVVTCGTGDLSPCTSELLAIFECPTVSEISATGDSTFAGTFSNDVSGCVDDPSAPLDTTRYLTLAPTASFVASAIPFSSDNPAAPTAVLTVTIGAGDRAAYEALFGCTPSGDWYFNLRFFGATKTFDATIVELGQSPAGGGVRAVCGGRHVRLHARVEAES